MVKTAAERQRARRAKIRQDDETYNEHLQKDRQRKSACRSLMTNSELTLLRVRVKKNTEEWRARKTGVVLNVTLPNAMPYKSPASLGRARRKVERCLPNSPNKRRVVLSSIMQSEGIVVDKTQHIIRRHKLSEDALREVKEFYESDAISRVMPGKDDTMIVRHEDGTKTKERKQHLTMTVMEAYELFHEKTEMTIKKSTFAELRPKHVLLSSKMPHNVCACKYHGNVILLLEALHRVCPSIPLYSRNEFISLCVCDIEDETCMSNWCRTCRDNKLLNNHIRDLTNLDDNLQWYRWDADENKYIIKILCAGKIRDAIDELKAQLPKFMWHAFVKEKQSATYSKFKNEAQAADSSTCLLQMDFAENYTCSFQDEIQSAHWRQSQVTLYTIMAYHRDKVLSMVIASDTRDHDKKSVAAFTVTAIDSILGEHSTVKDIQIWTDGPSSQFKNRYIFGFLVLLNHKYEHVELSWNFTATSHGKGPNDAIGGNVKATARRRVMTRQNMVKDASSFIKAVEDANCKIKMVHMTVKEIDEGCEKLDLESMWNIVPNIAGTSTTHCVKTVGSGIECKLYTDAVEVTKHDNIIPNHYLIPKDTTPALSEPAIETTSTNEQSEMRSSALVKPAAGPKKRTDAKQKKNKKQKEDDPANICGNCGGNYFDDDSDDAEDWVQCPPCKVWFHLTCAGVYENCHEDFICDTCKH